MNKRILLPLIVILGGACVAYLVIAHRSSEAAMKSEGIPSKFAGIQVGMSESQVLSLVGQPLYKSRYAKYENKPPAFWAALQKQAAAAEADQTGNDGAPNMASIRAASQLTHQYRDVWQYKPVPTLLLTLYFSDQGTLLNMGTASGGGRESGSGSRTPGRG